MRKHSLTRTLGAVALLAWLLHAPGSRPRRRTELGRPPGPADPPARRAGVRRRRQDAARRQPAERHHLGDRHRLPPRGRRAEYRQRPGRPRRPARRPPPPRRRSGGQRPLITRLPRPFDPGPGTTDGQCRSGRAGCLGRRPVVRRGFPLVAAADVRRPVARGPEDPHPRLSINGSLDLPFCPRALAFFPEGSRLVVADAFGGQLAVVQTKPLAIESVRSLPAHNIRGLAFTPDGRTLVLAHQVLNRLAQTSFDDVHWGQLIRNHLRVLRTEALLSHAVVDAQLVHSQEPLQQPPPSPPLRKEGKERAAVSPPYEGGARGGSSREPNSIVNGSRPDATLLEGSKLFDLGDVGYAAGDPGAIAFDRRGHVMVALSGMDEVAIAADLGQGAHRIVVGRRPIALATSPDGESLYVADSLDDTISVITIATGQRPATIGLGPHPEPSAADRGERLFSSAKLSHDGWMSCQSCHTDGHTNNLLSDTLGDGSYGAPKRVPTLLGVASTGPWTWTGSMARLGDQVSKSIMTTMQGPRPSDAQVADLIAYLESLEPPSPKLWSAGPDATKAAVGAGVLSSNPGNARRAIPRPITPHPSFSTWDCATRWGTMSSTPLPCAGQPARRLPARRPRPIARRRVPEGAPSPRPGADARGDRRSRRVPRDALSVPRGHVQYSRLDVRPLVIFSELNGVLRRIGGDRLRWGEGQTAGRRRGLAATEPACQSLRRRLDPVHQPPHVHEFNPTRSVRRVQQAFRADSEPPPRLDWRRTPRFHRPASAAARPLLPGFRGSSDFGFWSRGCWNSGLSNIPRWGGLGSRGRASGSIATL